MLVEQRAAGGAEAVVEDLADHRVPEGEAAGGLLDELRFHRLVEIGQHLLLLDIVAEGDGQDARLERLAEDGGQRQELAAAQPDPVEAPADHVADQRRHDRAGPGLVLPDAVPLADQAVLAERPDELLDEQRVPLGDRVERVAQPLIGRPVEQRGDELTGLGLVERGEPDRLGQPLAGQPEQEAGQRLGRFIRPIGADQDQRQPARQAREAIDQVDRRAVGGVEVFQAEQDRLRGRQRAEEAVDRAVEVARRPGIVRRIGEVEVVAQLRDDVRQVGQDVGELGAQPVGRLAQEVVRQGVADGAVRERALAVVAAAGQAEVAGLRGLPHDAAHEGALAGAGRRAEHDDLGGPPAALQGPGQRPQLSLPAHHGLGLGERVAREERRRARAARAGAPGLEQVAPSPVGARVEASRPGPGRAPAPRARRASAGRASATRPTTLGPAAQLVTWRWISAVSSVGSASSSSRRLSTSRW